MRGAGLILIAVAVLALDACSKRDSLYLDHTREEARPPAKHTPPKPAATATNAERPAT